MPYQVVLRARSLKQLQDLPREAQVRLASQIDGLVSDPFPPASKPLVGPFAGLHKLRVGDYRVAYEVDEQARLVRVLAVGHRRDVYKRLARSGD
jgi:mRNA interferase RelE/StbE